jgi:hypothetical protein
MNAGVGRRTFITGSLAAVGASAVAAPGAEVAAGGKRDVYVLQVYQFKNSDAAKSAESIKRADEYFQAALIPALGRAGAGPVGVLVETGKAETNYYVLIPLPSFEAAGMLPHTLDADAEYTRAGEAFLKAPPKDPGYNNLETRIMLAAEFMPKLAVPEKKETRLFELRRYRSPSEPAFRKKLEMFGTGELAIFKRVGLNPVFYGEMLSGPDMPNITYMLTYVDEDAKKKAWGAFGGDAEWHKLSKTPGYTDPEIIANIKSVSLKPTGYSQI